MDAPARGPASPFHDGERRVQRRLGVAARAEAAGRRSIRDHLIDQHREFFATQHLLLMGSADAAGRPWVSVLAGPPGFASSPDPARLRVAALPAGGAPGVALQRGQRIGLLGIDHSNRRRNRLNGRVEELSADGFVVVVEQSFGNCPKYIQLRDTTLPEGHDWRPVPVAPRRVDALASPLVETIRGADHFYIASHRRADARDPRDGVDVSHRGGRPGFVTVDAAGDVVFPDFAGNRFYNTLGNIEADGRAGLAFVDTGSGSLWTLTGRARIDWRGEAETGFRGAERLVRVAVDEAFAHDGLLPMRWRLLEPSPALDGTGRWDDAGPPSTRD